MTSTDPSAIADAEQLGRQAALDGEPMSRNPFSAAQGSPTRVLAIAYRRGFHLGEAEQAEGSHFKDAS